MSSRQHELPLPAEVSDAVSTSSGDAAVRAVSTQSAPAETADKPAVEPQPTAESKEPEPQPEVPEEIKKTHHHTLTTKHADHASETKHADNASETKRQINKPRPVSAAERERRAAEFRMRLKAGIEKREKMTQEERDATNWGGVPCANTSPDVAMRIVWEMYGTI